jgi:hypothetical protein
MAGSDRSGYILYTNNFKEEEVYRLSEYLKTRFNLNNAVHTRTSITNKKAYIIYIKGSSRDLFVYNIKP